LGTPPRLYNQIARTIAVQEGNTIVENSRLFALINIAMADAGIASWETKYVYDLWRPIVAIRNDGLSNVRGGLDRNTRTTGDSGWTPLGAPASNQSGTNFTPPFPAYTSGHATFGAAAFDVIANFYGTDAIAFSFMSDELNGVTTDQNGQVRPAAPRSFTSLSQAAWENAISRIYLGIHWRFDATAGIAQGGAIADWAFARLFRPLRDPIGSFPLPFPMAFSAVAEAPRPDDSPLQTPQPATQPVEPARIATSANASGVLNDRRVSPPKAQQVDDLFASEASFGEVFAFGLVLVGL
jgi:hypothetical protein